MISDYNGSYGFEITDATVRAGNDLMLGYSKEQLRKKETQINRKQHKSTIDSNTDQHHNTFVERQGTMSHPVAPDVPNA